MRYFLIVLIVMFVPAAMVSADEFTENPCVDEAYKKRHSVPRRRTAGNQLDWKCMQYNADQGEAFYQFYVGLMLIHGKNFSEEKNITKAISLLTAAARKGHNSAIPVLARLYYAGDENFPADIDLAYQWASLVSYPVKENMIIRGSHEEEDRKKIENSLTIMEKIETEISPEHAEKLRSLAHDLLK